MPGPKLKNAKNPFGLWLVGFFVALCGWMAYPLLQEQGAGLAPEMRSKTVEVETFNIDDLVEAGLSPEASAPGSPMEGGPGGDREDNISLMAGDPLFGGEAGAAGAPVASDAGASSTRSGGSGSDDLGFGSSGYGGYDKGSRGGKGGGLKGGLSEGFGGGGGGGGGGVSGGRGGASTGFFGKGGNPTLTDSKSEFPKGEFSASAPGTERAGAQVGKLRSVNQNQQVALRHGQDEASKNKMNALFDAEKKQQGMAGGDAKGAGGGARLNKGADKVASLKNNAAEFMNPKTTFTPPPPKEVKQKKEEKDNSAQLIMAITGMMNPLFSGVSSMMGRR